jgi:hypothetical protein
MRVRRDRARVFVAVVATILSLILLSAGASAQTIVQQLPAMPLAQSLPDLILREIVLQPGTIGPAHVAHFTPLTNDPNNPVVGIVDSFNRQMATQFSTFPLGSSTGGLTYVFDESVGTFRRGSPSFGPLFAERALTIGRRKMSVGFNYQRTSYNTFEGQNLNDGSIKFYLRHQDCCHFADPANGTGFSLTPLNGSDTLNPPFKGDIIEAALSLKATTHTTALFANYGVTNRWDIGLAVPFVRVNLDSSVHARIIRLVTCAPLALDPSAVEPPDCAGAHTFEPGNPNATLTLQRSGRATGLGDIVLRSKYHFLRAGGGGLAVALDLRLPTGDENNLLGTGGTQGKVFLVASDERGRFGRHVNIGYTVASGTVAGTPVGLPSALLPDEVNYSGGFEFVSNARLTLMGDFVGRTLRGAGHLDMVSTPFQYNEPTLFFTGVPGPGCGGFAGFTCKTAYFDQFTPRPGNLTLLLGTGGVKFNVVGNLLVSGSVLFPLTHAGLRSRVTTTIGLDYAF